MCPCFPHSPMRRRRPCCSVPTGIAPETCCRGVSTSAPVRPRVCCAPQHFFSCSVLFSSSARLSNVERARSQVQTGPHTTLATTAAASHQQGQPHAFPAPVPVLSLGLSFASPNPVRLECRGTGGDRDTAWQSRLNHRGGDLVRLADVAWMPCLAQRPWRTLRFAFRHRQRSTQTTPRGPLTAHWFVSSLVVLALSVDTFILWT